MKKQTKVLLAASLFTLGASFSSMAATKTYDWRIEDGQHVCYDKNGELYTEAWVESLGTKYYVDGDGQIVTDSWIVEDDGDTFYVLSDGAMLVNNWKTMLPEGADEEDEEATFYFGTDGKMATEKRISWNGNYCYVDENGEMLTGWVEYSKISGTTTCKPADDKTAAKYLFYVNEDGYRVTEQWINTYGPEYTEEEIEEFDAEQEEDNLSWYYIKDNGAVQTGRNKDIDGQTYFFNSTTGKMLTGWVKYDATTKTYAEHTADFGRADAGKVFFCGGKDQGWVKKDQWVKTYTPNQYKAAMEDSEGLTSYWYWIDEDGKVFIPENATSANVMTFDAEAEKVFTVTSSNALKGEELEVNDETYLFKQNGTMMSGLVKLGSKQNMFYYGKSSDGAKKTGNQTIADANDDNYTFYFATSDKYKEAVGAAITGVENKHLYKDGLLQTAEEDYAVVTAGAKKYIVDENGKVQSSTKTEYDVDGKTCTAIIDPSEGRTKNNFLDWKPVVKKTK